jgi:5,10-methylene-tetrahydrofolate dehydrogenase/methenyl tetrahydrofolate cyclohydrolase
VVIGRSNIGRQADGPDAAAGEECATVTICHSGDARTWAPYTRQADVVVAAVGKPQHR